MRLVEFLIALLEAHAETLKRLAALFGEDNLLELLEMAGEDEQAARDRPDIDPSAFERPRFASEPGSAYTEIGGAVREMNLPSVLEFHLWTYPLYRAYIESAVDLDSRIPGPGGEVGLSLVDQAVASASAWVGALPMGAPVRDQASRAAHVPWLRFRAQMLKRIGRRPVGPVY